MKRLSRTLTESAAGTGEAAKAFEALGLSAKDLINLPVDQQLGERPHRLFTIGQRADDHQAVRVGQRLQPDGERPAKSRA